LRWVVILGDIEFTEGPALATGELLAERDVVERIERVHSKHVENAIEVARQLAEEAATQTEDGLRDLVDEDDEADAAIEASMVRQHAAQAMNAHRRAIELQRVGDAHAFGSIGMDPVPDDDDSLDQVYVGRVTVLDGDEVLMVDWRAGAAAPFYQATPIERHGVQHRRHLIYEDVPEDPGGVGSSGAQLIGYSDEVFDVDALAGGLADGPELRGEAAILAAVSAPTPEQMRSVVATIQAEQDAIVRAPSNRPLVVQGAPGTGKTVVALHRAAYLLYNQRATLAETGVLIVGPTNEFLRYIGGVLPSLGESGVVSMTANDLYTGVLTGNAESDEAATLKGAAEMVDVLAHAVRDRQRRPTKRLDLMYGSKRVRIELAELHELFEHALRFRTHNAGAAAFRSELVEALASKVYDPTFSNLEDARATFRNSAKIRNFLLRHWPTLTAEQALNDLYGSPALLRRAVRAGGLDVAAIQMLERERTPELDLADRRWSRADIPLLDELLFLLGGVDGDRIESERFIERDDAGVFELEDLDDEVDWDDDEQAAAATVDDTTDDSFTWTADEGGQARVGLSDRWVT